MCKLLGYKIKGHRLTFFVPSTKNINEKIDNSIYVNRVAQKMSELFGGATSTAAIGYWVSPTAGLVKEDTIMVFSFISEQDFANDEKMDEIFYMAMDLKSELTQDAILIDIDGDMTLI